MEDGDFAVAFPGLFLAAFRVAHRILGSVDDAEDAAAEAMARTLRRWERVRDLPYRNAWVVRVATNVAVDRCRRRGLPPAVAASALVDVPDPAEAVTIRLALAAALAALPRRQREVIALRYLGGLSEDEVAGSLGISRNSVKKHVGRGVTALRRRLGPDWQEANLALE